MSPKKIDHESRKHHEELSPSALPILAKCPCYKSRDTVGAAAKRGTKLHEELEQILSNPKLKKEVNAKNA